MNRRKKERILRKILKKFKRIKVIIPQEIYQYEEKKIIAEILLNEFLENTKDKWMEFNWGRKRFKIRRIEGRGNNAKRNERNGI